jgi:2-hydroxychromene-2-carboxylate isomerase
MDKQVDFFFSCASTYTYLAAMRAEPLAAAAGVRLRWRPFNLRAIMTEQDNRPFVGKPVKTGYMWRDIERTANRLGIPFSGAPHYPLAHALPLNRVAVLAASEGWAPDFVRASYKLWFLDKRDPGDPASLSETLGKLGKDPAKVVARSESEENLKQMEAETQVARELGLFGSPSFVVDREVFWGNDRLEEAIAWRVAN